MYSQYQSYQPTNNRSTSVSAQWTGSQWVTPSSSGSTVNNPSAVQSSTFSTYNNNSQNTKPPTTSGTIMTAPGGAPATAPTATNLGLSQTYTKYYHQWHNKSQEQNRLAMALPQNSSQRDEALRAAQWADYYAQQSSAAAHYHAGSAHGGSVPPPLPPAPPADNSSSSINNCVQQQQQKQEQHRQQQQQQQQKQQQQQQQQNSENNNTRKFPSRWDRGPPVSTTVAPPPAVSAWQRPSEHHHQQPQQQPQQQQQQQQQQPQAPDGMKNYVHRCLSRCNTDEQRNSVQKEIERVISNAIQTGTMHTMNWDTFELIPVPGDRGLHHNHQLQHQQHEGQRPTKKSRTNAGSGNSNGNYYGPNTSGSPTRSTVPNVQGNSNNENKHRQNSQVSYYGPNDNSGSGNSVTSQDINNFYGNYDKLSQGQKHQHQQQKNKNKIDSSIDDNKYGYYGSMNRTNSFGEAENDFIALPSSMVSNNQQQSKKKKQNKNKKQQQKHKLDGFNRTTEKMANRANRFSGKGGIASATATASSGSGKNVERYMGRAVIGGSQRKLDETDYEQMTVKGTCTTLEKEYLRLTAPPRAELVRPKQILEQHLQNLKLQRKHKSSQKKRDYTWFCSQFKALRQDLTVQRINDAITVDTYETHARVALEEGDLNEYNQCQTQLKELYRILSPSSVSSRKEALKNQNEFIAYRIIYYVFLTGNKKHDGGSSDLLELMLSLSNEQREDPCIQHALKVRVAVAEFDYHGFFRLQDSCPNLGAFLMDIMVPQIRFGALQRVCKAFRPSLPVKFILNEFGFDYEDCAQFKEGKDWLISCGCAISDDGKTLLTKDSAVTESNLTKKSSLI
eukprot:CAMPEP_0195281204 /NCGR_PEP_ID=MMETSP0707-20130614/618_1 /TAXON_ID=33640 /ORGANISM="Asterionellopsis glacialis, Strain CCMP134" /LENGTH=841 /DNA_ID=CAMNT_0040340071 /DNA_START=31 /DNA_END=2556 /DNA_ORIENTATION=-